MDDQPSVGRMPRPSVSKGYQLSGKIMLSAIVILFAVVVLMVCLHIYARWYLLRARRRRRRSRPSHLIFYVDSANPASAADRGLDPAVLRSLPVFSYSPKTRPDPIECAVCLSEFQENEMGRVLPRCNHTFHTSCIDMWFHSHSTCPLCRSPVEPVEENLSAVSAPATDPVAIETGSSSGSSSIVDRRKEFEMARVTIEVPRVNAAEEMEPCSPPSGQGLKSPATRLLSFRRILSMSRRSSPASLSPPGVGPSCGSAPPEMDVERGTDALAPEPFRVQTPR